MKFKICSLLVLSVLLTACGGNGPAFVDDELSEVPVISIDHLTHDQIRAFRIADNKICEGSVWDYEALKIEFSELIDLLGKVKS